LTHRFARCGSGMPLQSLTTGLAKMVQNAVRLLPTCAVMNATKESCRVASCRQVFAAFNRDSYGHAVGLPSIFPYRFAAQLRLARRSSLRGCDFAGAGSRFVVRCSPSLWVAMQLSLGMRQRMCSSCCAARKSCTRSLFQQAVQLSQPLHELCEAHRLRMH